MRSLGMIAPTARPTVGRRGTPCGARLGGTLLLLVAGACRDDAPMAPRPASPAGGVAVVADDRPDLGAARAPAADEVVIARTYTLSAAAAGRGTGPRTPAAAPRTRQTIRMRGAALARTTGTQVAPVAATRGETADDLLRRGLLGPIQVAARPASAVCSNAPAWTKTRRIGDVTVVMRGTGDVPYTELSISRGGAPVGTIRARWQRLRDSWRLVSQDAATTDGRFTDAYAVARPRGADPLAEAPIPARACVEPGAAIAAAEVDASVVGLAGLTGHAPAFGAVSALGVTTALSLVPCEISEEAIEDACRDLALDLADKSALVAATALTAAAACLLAPPPLNVIACAAAMATHTAASAALAAAYERYKKCRDAARQAAVDACCGKEATSRNPFAVVAAAPGRAAPRASAAAVEEVACEDAPVGGGGGGGSGGCTEYCAYTDYYDDEGNYLYSELEGCWLECAT